MNLWFLTLETIVEKCLSKGSPYALDIRFGFPYHLQLYEGKKEDNQPLRRQVSNRLNYFIRNFYPIRIVFGSFGFFLTKFSHSDSFLFIVGGFESS